MKFFFLPFCRGQRSEVRCKTRKAHVVIPLGVAECSLEMVFSRVYANEMDLDVAQHYLNMFSPPMEARGAHFARETKEPREITARANWRRARPYLRTLR